MPDLAEESHPSGKAFGLTPSRVRGVIAILVLVFGMYAILFESEPPPVFEDVEISIPERPKPDFSERTIVLPDFEGSPVEEGVEPGEGVVITPPEVDLAPEPEPVNESSEPEQPDIVQEAEPEPTAEPASTAEPAPTAEAESPQEAQKTESPDDTAAKRTALPGYFVQIAALRSQGDAEELAELIGSRLGEPHYVQAINRDDKIFYRVRLGPYGDDEARARNTLTRLRELDLVSSSEYFVDLE